MSSTFRKFFKSSSDGKKLTKKRTSGTAEVIDSAPLPPRYSQDHAPLQPPPSFASRPPSIAPSVASHVTQLPTYESVVPPGSRGTSGLRWQSNGYFGAAEPPLPSIPRSPTPEPLSEEQIVAFAQTKERLARLPKELWDVIGNMLDPASAASLKLSCRVIHDAMSQHHFFQLNEPHNKQHKLEFLYAGTLYASVPDGSPPSPTTADDEVDEVTLADVDALPLSTAVGPRKSHFDQRLPYHLFCFNCCAYHSRLKPGLESLTPSYITNPVFICPNLKTLPTPRLALTPSRRLPFTLPQLLARASRLSPAHGIHTSALSKTWVDVAQGFDQDPDADPEMETFTSYNASDGGPIGWRHRTQIRTHHSHVLLRVSSTHVLPQRLLSTSELNRLLITRSNYEPYFSTCQHWHTAGPVGPLLSLAKCAIGHAQAPYASESAKEGANVDKKGKQKRSVIPAAGSAAVSVTGMGSRVTSQCAECRPLRRCEQCGTEYLMQLKVAEDRVRRKSSASGGAAPEPVLPKFRPYLSVTRYSDLGPCVRPDEPQWLSVAGSDGEVPNEVRMPVCAESPKHLKSVRGAFEGDESSGGGGVGGAAIPLGRRIEWVREHMKELDEERDRERMLADRRAKPQLMTNKS